MITEQVYQKNFKKFGIDSVEKIDQILTQNTNLLKTTQNYKKLQDLAKEAIKNVRPERQIRKPLNKHIQKMQSLIDPNKRIISKDKLQKKKNHQKRKPINSQRQLQNYNSLAQKYKSNNEGLRRKIKEQVDAQNQKIKKGFNKSAINYQKPSYDKNFLAKIEKFLKVDDEVIEQNLSLSSIEQNRQIKTQQKIIGIKKKKPKKLIKKYLNTSQKNKTQNKKFSELCKEIEKYEQKKRRGNSRSFIEDLKEMKNLSNSFISQELFEVDDKPQQQYKKGKIKNKFKQNIASMRKLIN